MTLWDPDLIDPSTATEFHSWIDVDQATGVVSILYYTTENDPDGGNDDVHMRLATSIDGGTSWTVADVTTITSNETGGYSLDYLHYIGLDVHQGTAHGLFSFRWPGAGTDLEAVYVNAAFVNPENKLTITGDDNPLAPDDLIEVRRHQDNADYLQVKVNGVQQFAGRYDTIGKIIIDGGDGVDTITLQNLDNASGPEVTITGGPGDDILNVNTNNAGVARVRITGSETFSQVNIGTGGGIIMDQDGDRVLRTQELSVASTGFIDLADNEVIIDYAGSSPVAMI